MLKPIIAFLFLAAFAIQTFEREFIVVDYFANTKAYAKNCENKEAPKMHCNGKCQMMKKLKQEEKKEEQNSERKGDNKIEIVLSPRAFYTTHKFPVVTTAISFADLAPGKEIKMPRSILRPPAC